MAILDELLVGLGFDYDSDDLESFNKDLDTSISAIKKMATAVIAGTTALIGFTSATANASDRQGKLSNQTGVSVENIDALEFALKRSGGSADSLASNLENLSVRISETSRGIGSGVEAFGILGVSVMDANGNLKDTDDVLLEVSDSLQRFSKSEQIELADKLGLRDSILLLQEGSAGIKQLTDEARALGVTTSEDAALSADFVDALTDLWQIVKQVSRVITRNLAPAITNVVGTFKEWWVSTREIIEQNIPDYMDKAAMAIKLLTIAAVGFIAVKLATTIISLIGLFKGLSLGVLATNVAIAAIPLLIGAIGAALLLALEDAKTFAEGGESLFGDLIDKFPEWENEIRLVIDALNNLIDVGEMVSKGWGEIFSLFSSGTFLEDLKRNLNQLGDDISNYFNGLWDDIVSGFTDKFVKPIKDGFREVTDFLGVTTSVEVEKARASSGLPTISNEESGVIFAPPPEVETIMGGIMNSPKSDFGNVNKYDQNKSSRIDVGGITVNVNGDSNNPSKTGKEIGEEIRNQLEPLFRQASRDLNSSVIL